MMSDPKWMEVLKTLWQCFIIAAFTAGLAVGSLITLFLVWLL